MSDTESLNEFQVEVHAMSIIISMLKNPSTQKYSNGHGSWISICVFSMNGLVDVDIAWTLRSGFRLD